MGRRRGHNEGAIYQVADGTWRGAIDLGIVGGKRKRRYFRGKTRRAVAAKIAKAIADLEVGTPVLDERQTVGQYLTQWLESRQGKIRPTTHAMYEYIIRIHLAPEFGHHRLTRLSAQHVQAFIDHLAATDLTPKTIRHIHGTLRAALNRAVKLGVIRQNVALLVELPKAIKHLVKPWTPEEIERFLAAARGDRFEAAYYLALGAGLREGEIAGLAWSLIDTDAGTARITQKVKRERGRGLQLGRPKGQDGGSTVVLPATALKKLHERRIAQLRERLAAGAWPTEEELRVKLVDDLAQRGDFHADLVFTTSVGTAVDPIAFYRHFQQIREKAGLPPHRFHDLRHDHASFLLSLGVSLKEIQASLRHSQIGLTADTYTHLLAAVSQENAAKMDTLFRDVAGES